MTLRARLLLQLLPLGVAGAVGLIFLLNTSVHKVMHDQVTKRGRLALENVAAEGAAGFQGDREEILVFLLQSAKTRAGALYAYALDPRGRVLAHTNVLEHGKTYGDEWARETLGADEPLTSVLHVNDEPALGVSLPVWEFSTVRQKENFLFLGEETAGHGKRLGTLHIGLPLREINETERAMTRKFYGVVGVLGAFFLATTMVFLRRIVDPVRVLSEASARIAHGDYGARLPPPGPDEVGQLSANFARMTEALRNAVQSREESLALLDTLIATAPIGIAFLDRDFRFLRVNRALADINGRSVEEHLGRTVAETLPDYADQLLPLYKRVVERGEVIANVETSGEDPRQPGRRVHCVSSFYPVRHADGSVFGVGVVVADVTQKKQAEEAIRSLNAQLEARVNQRTAQLTAANRELEAFSYSVSHDLRSPLRSIDGFSQTILEDYGDKLDDTGRGYLARIRAASQRMAQLIDDLLELARVTRTEMRHETVNLSAIAQSIADDLRRLAPERRVEWVIAPHLLAEGDARLLRVLLTNLLENAWKFTHKHAQARIEVGEMALRGQTAFFVRDDGAGFDMAYVDKLFGPFQRLHEPRDFAGTGIGLATVQRIAQRHGGRAWAEGAVEKGATFYFTVPGAPAMAGAERRAASLST